MSNAVDAVRRRLLRAADALNAAGVPYAVVGGNAVAAWVSRVDEAAVRNTRDVDLLLRRADLPAATEALEQAGFLHRKVASLGQAGSMDIFIEGIGGKARDALHILFDSERVHPDSPAGNASVEESENTGEFRLISLPALVRMKLTAWRDKDRVHLRDLLSVGLLEQAAADDLPPVLVERLQFILDNPDE